MKILMFTGSWVHPTPWAQNHVVRQFRSMGHHVDHLPIRRIGQTDISRYDATIIYFHIKQDQPHIIQVLTQYVQQGGVLIAFHGAAASFKTSDTWFDMLGGRFVGHPPVMPITVTVEDQQFILVDEQYQFDTKEDVHVQLTSQSSDGEQPCIWRHDYGEGQVYYCALGHHFKAVRSKGFHRVVQWMMDCVQTNQ